MEADALQELKQRQDAVTFWSTFKILGEDQYARAVVELGNFIQSMQAEESPPQATVDQLVLAKAIDDLKAAGLWKET